MQLDTTKKINLLKLKTLRLVISILVTLLFTHQSFAQSDIKIRIDTFSVIPPEIDGCSCYFSCNSKDFKKRAYIYMNDFAQTSFLKINGKLTKFTQTDFKIIDKNTTEAKAISSDYELIVKVKKGRKSGYESQLNNGWIILTNKKGNKITKTFYGECGC